jgi:hypothetical protein
LERDELLLRHRCLRLGRDKLLLLGHCRLRLWHVKLATCVVRQQLRLRRLLGRELLRAELSCHLLMGLLGNQLRLSLVCRLCVCDLNCLLCRRELARLLAGRQL